MTLMLHCNQMIPKLYAFAKILCGVTVHLLLMCVCVGLCALRLVVVLLSFRSLAACSRKLNAYVSVLCQDDNMREKNVEC